MTMSPKTKKLAIKHLAALQALMLQVSSAQELAELCAMHVAIVTVVRRSIDLGRVPVDPDEIEALSERIYAVIQPPPALG